MTVRVSLSLKSRDSNSSVFRRIFSSAGWANSTTTTTKKSDDGTMNATAFFSLSEFINFLFIFADWGNNNDSGWGNCKYYTSFDIYSPVLFF